MTPLFRQCYIGTAADEHRSGRPNHLNYHRGVVDRRIIGSWLEGPSSLHEQKEGEYQGSALGLPEHGRGSLAPLGPRVLALIIDWVFCSLIAVGFLGYQWGEPGAQSFLPLIVFLVENVLLVGVLGTTIGHFVLGLGVITVDRERTGLFRALIRAVLIALVIPAVVWDKDGRGLHDRLAGTMLLKMR